MASEIYEDDSAYARQSGAEPVAQTAFGRRLCSQGFGQKDRISGRVCDAGLAFTRLPAML